MFQNTTGKMFRISKPYGYYIPEVEEAVKKYNETIDKLQNVIVLLQESSSEKDTEIHDLKQELRRMHSELSMMEVPSMSSIQEKEILNTFKNTRVNKTPIKEEKFNISRNNNSDNIDETIMIF